MFRPYGAFDLTRHSHEGTKKRLPSFEAASKKTLPHW